MRIEVIEPADRGKYRVLLRRAFALRHRVYVEGRGCEFLRRPDGLDFDSYDRGATTHVLLLDGNRLIGHVRLIPGGYVQVGRSDVARIRNVAGNAKLYGLSRFCISPQIGRSLARRTATARLFAAALRCVIERGCETLLFETDPAMIFLLRVVGFTVENVGEPALAGGRPVQPVVMQLDAPVLSALPIKIAKWTRGLSVPDQELIRAPQFALSRPRRAGTHRWPPQHARAWDAPRP